MTVAENLDHHGSSVTLEVLKRQIFASFAFPIYKDHILFLPLLKKYLNVCVCVCILRLKTIIERVFN